VQVKAADERDADVAALEALRARPGASRARRLIEREIQNLKAGRAAERDAAFEIEFYFGKSKNYVTIHDLRLEFDGQVAQIDHLIIDRLFQFWVCESKSFSKGVEINEFGEWSSLGSRAEGFGSPIEQNKKHIHVLGRVMSSSLISKPVRTKLIKPDYRNVVLIAKNAHIRRPRKPAEGVDAVLKVDQIYDRIQQRWDEVSTLAMFRVMGTGEIESIGRQLAALHIPKAFDWASRFGLSKEATGSTVVPSMTARGSPHDPSGDLCARCGGPVSFAERKWCRVNSARFGGQLYCRSCQAIVSPTNPVG
jgi:hypothetical protein